MTFKTFTAEQRKHIHTIMNVCDNLDNDDEVIATALNFLAQMCDPEVLECDVTFYITTDDDGAIKLEMVV